MPTDYERYQNAEKAFEAHFNTLLHVPAPYRRSMSFADLADMLEKAVMDDKIPELLNWEQPAGHHF